MASFFRRRFQALHEQTGTAALVVAIMALIAALAGGAIAASGGSGDGKATASAKGKQGPRGPRGKPGKPGPQGPAGPAGPQGPAGPKGDAGAPGANGTNGLNGATGSTGATGPIGATGPTGKGATGPTGPAGAPTPLPSEATETGTWRFISNGETEQFVAISFPIPLSVADAEDIVAKSLPKGAAPTTECPGNSEEPEAEPGFLCVYAAGFASNFFGNPTGAYKPLAAEAEEEGVVTSGTLLYFESAAAGKLSSGTFAVTAP